MMLPEANVQVALAVNEGHKKLGVSPQSIEAVLLVNGQAGDVCRELSEPVRHCEAPLLASSLFLSVVQLPPVLSTSSQLRSDAQDEPDPSEDQGTPAFQEHGDSRPDRKNARHAENVPPFDEGHSATTTALSSPASPEGDK